MTDGIEDIIRASRSSGGFTKKGYFTLATQKAKTKVSEYALPDPFFYCLEFVQSAVALGAVYVDVATDEQCTVISFANAHYTRTDMEQLFDFLITTRQEAHFRARRRLAVGIAAALSLKNATVIIETGDGTIDGSCRFEIGNIQDDALIGTPKREINGTFIKVRHARYINVFEACSREKNVLLERCEYLPITLVVNDEIPFGYVTARTPKLFGYRHTISFDEGDLYGAVAVPSEWKSEGGVKIVTNGIVITTMNFATPFGGLDGVVAFDRLHKTASQYEIVRDERVDELKGRLKQYMEKLCRMAGIATDDMLDFFQEKSTAKSHHFDDTEDEDNAAPMLDTTETADEIPVETSTEPSAETLQAIDDTRTIMNAYRMDDKNQTKSELSAPQVDLAPIHSVPRRPTLKSNCQEDAAQPPKHAPSDIPSYALRFPTINELTRLLESTPPTPAKISIIDLLHRFLYMHKKNHDFFAEVNHRLVTTDDLPKRPAAMKYIDLANEENSAVLINTQNPLIERSMKESINSTAAFFTLALLVSNALKVQSLRSPGSPSFDDEKIVATVLKWAEP